MDAAGTAEKTEQPPSPDEAAVEQAVKARQEARRRREEAGEGDEPRPTPEVVRAAARGEKPTDDEIHDALEFFLAQEGEEIELEPKSLKLNLGTETKPKYIRWVIQPVEDSEIVRIRKMSQKGTKAQKRRGEAEVDENLVARRIVLKGTVEPSLPDIAKALDLVDPADALYVYFKKFGKTGLILQISGEILNISGYDENDISELDAALG